MRELAVDLAMNYVDTSLGSEALKDPGARSAVFEKVFKPEALARFSGSTSRNILVLGAGASLAAFGSQAFPAAAQAMDELDRLLKKDLGARPKWVDERIKEEKDRLKIAYDYLDADEDFETHLAILSTIYSPQKVAEKLSAMYQERYWPHLSFELIAHMLKHRLVDVVINFNFDELLDQAIDEELGQSERHYIVSDGDCKSLDTIMVGERLKVPVHIKPHGTARHRSTLRFTKEHYFTLPEPMRLFMRNLIAGYTDDAKTNPPYRTNIITVGFGMRSLDLNLILRELAADGRSITMYHFNTGSWFKASRSKIVQKTGIALQKLVDVSKYPAHCGLEDALRSLLAKVSGFFRDQYRPRGIARHEIVHELFFDETRRQRIPQGGPDAAGADADYHRARLCTELVIGLAKNHGRIDLSALVDDRVGMYFDLLRDVTSRLTRVKSAASLDSVLKLFEAGNYRLPVAGIEHNILSAGFPESGDGGRDEWLWNALRSALRRIDNAEIQDRVKLLSRKEKSLEMHKRFKVLVESEARDINPSFRHRHLLLSQAPNPDEVLHTNLGYSLKFAEIVGDGSKWDILLAVSEYGGMLDRCAALLPPGALQHHRFCVVLAKNDLEEVSDTRVASFRARLTDPSRLEEHRLPFWLHNRHMIMGLKREDGKGKPGGLWTYTSAIRYDRRGLSNRINPVYIDKSDTDDLKRLMDSFFGYVWQARNPDWLSRSLTPFDVKAQVEICRDEMLGEWWDELGR